MKKSVKKDVFSYHIIHTVLTSNFINLLGYNFMLHVFVYFLLNMGLRCCNPWHTLVEQHYIQIFNTRNVSGGFQFYATTFFENNI